MRQRCWGDAPGRGVEASDVSLKDRSTAGQAAQGRWADCSADRTSAKHPGREMEGWELMWRDGSHQRAQVGR